MKKGWKIVIGIICSLGLATYIVFYKEIAKFFFAENPNGELLKVTLSVFGGIGLIWGLWINNKRIKEQSRQNKIAEDSNSDKRFGEAVGYLSSKNSSSVLGGIFSLFQLAIEDDRYKPIVANLFCGFLRDKSESLYKLLENENIQKLKAIENDSEFEKLKMEIFMDAKSPIVIQTIIDMLLNSGSVVFKNIDLNLSHVVLKNIKFDAPIKNCDFSYSKLESCNFNDIIDTCGFYKSKLYFCNFEKDVENVRFLFSKMTNCTFSASDEYIQFPKIFNNNIRFDYSEMVCCKIFGFSLNGCTFDQSTISNSLIQVIQIQDCSFKECNASSLTIKDAELINTSFPEISTIHFENCH